MTGNSKVIQGRLETERLKELVISKSWGLSGEPEVFERQKRSRVSQRYLENELVLAKCPLLLCRGSLFGSAGLVLILLRFVPL